LRTASVLNHVPKSTRRLCWFNPSGSTGWDGVVAQHQKHNSYSWDAVFPIQHLVEVIYKVLHHSKSLYILDNPDIPSDNLLDL
jgi:hypothetical protein